MRISGFYYPPGSSKQHVADLKCDEVGNCRITLTDGEEFTARLDELWISDRLGNMPRQLRLPDGELFETNANNEVDALLRSFRQQGLPALLHRLESRAVFILPLLFVAGLAILFTYKWGIPTASQAIAFSLPSDKLSLIGNHTLSALDKTMLQPSKLSDEQQEQIRQRFNALTSEVGSGFTYQLHFRRMGNNLPNAFALPDGSIVMMDGLVDISSHSWEVDSVLLHEIAHVEQRHGLQMAIQDTFLTLAISLALGDAVSTSQAVASLPAILIESKYSRDFEQSADDYASNYMLTHDVDPNHFADMLQKLEESHKDGKDESMTDDEESFWDYFASHPKMEERIARVREKSI